MGADRRAVSYDPGGHRIKGNDICFHNFSFRGRSSSSGEHQVQSTTPTDGNKLRANPDALRAGNVRTQNGFPFMGNSYAKINIGTLLNLLDIQDGFRRVPLDSYVEDGSRFKDIARFMIRGRSVIKTPHGELFHPINAGTYGHHASRAYPEVSFVDIEALKPVVEIFNRVANIDKNQEILLQRQRVVNVNGTSSRTVREGPHQDGIKKLAILCVNRINVAGGISFIYDEQRDIVFAGQLEAGDILFIDDVKLWHDTTPIRQPDVGMPGYRDIIILTWPSCRQEDHVSEEFEDTYCGT